jgi:predicted NAD/FAD-dependent oxidoreductase
MDLAIVGAGAAGAAAAYALREASVDVTVFEASDRVGGRAATGREGGRRYDYGANYVKADSPRVADLITAALPTDGLVDVGAPVWTFDATGEITVGDDRDEHKWTYEAGIQDLAVRLLDAAGADVEMGTRVGRFSHAGGTWWLVDDGGRDLGTFDAVVLTPPAPEAADLLAATEWDDPRLSELQAAVDGVSYRPIDAVLLSYPFEVEYPWYALVNTDREHAVGWLSREELKDGHVPAGAVLFVVQMAPGWSSARFEDPDGEVVADVAALVADLLGDDRFADPAWSDRRRWRHALPNGGADASVLRAAEDDGLYVAGDWVAGDGRVHLAVESGLDVGERIVRESGP